MKIALFFYNILYCITWLVTLPANLIKQKRRGGWGTGLSERFCLYDVPYAQEPKGGLYVHAVSVGEVLIALKFLRAWLAEHEGGAVLATSTATGHATALNAELPGLRVIYSPYDLPGLPGRCFDRFEPDAIVLVEAELWPNFARAAQARGIPMAMINARMSSRSEKRYRMVKWLSKRYFAYLSAMGVQDMRDAKRFEAIGVNPAIIHVTGSIKFDQQSNGNHEVNQEFVAILKKLKSKKQVVLAASTHAGEEVLIAAAIRYAGGFPLIVPRHAERRYAVQRELQQDGWHCLLRTDDKLPDSPSEDICYIVDTTGELKDWTALADIAVIGKSFLSIGGQNPAEAVACGVPVLTGPHMENFSSLVELLVSVNGITQCSAEQLPDVLKAMLDDSLRACQQALCARDALQAHAGATARTMRMLVESLHIDY